MHSMPNDIGISILKSANQSPINPQKNHQTHEKQGYSSLMKIERKLKGTEKERTTRRQRLRTFQDLLILCSELKLFMICRRDAFGQPNGQPITSD